MENKKNYVDGVDVSECEHYRAEIETKMPYGEYVTEKDKCHYNGIEIIQNCKGNKGCIYKQLKRLQAENEKLKEEIYGLEQELLGYNKGVMAAENILYKQCLKEIKEYIGTCCHRFSKNHKDLCFGCEYDKEVCDYSIILDKINEVME